MRAEVSELELQLYGARGEKEVAGPVRDVAVVRFTLQTPTLTLTLTPTLFLTPSPTLNPNQLRFTLRASGLPALDRNLFSKDSSDPYFKLKARDGNGFLHPLGQSKVLSKNLNPEWEPVEVSAEALGGYRRLHIEVLDHDIGLDDDQIGVVELDLPEDLGAALGEGEPPLERSFPIATQPLTGPLADVYHGGVGTLEGSYTLVERGAAAPAPAPKKKSIFGRKPISPPPSPPAETSAPETSAPETSAPEISAPEISVANISAVEISRLEAKLVGLREQEAVLHGEVVRLKTGGMLECREAVAVACRTVEEDETRMAEEEARKKAAKKQTGKKKGGKKQGEEAGEEAGGGSKDSSVLKRLGGSVTGLVLSSVQDTLDNLAGVGDDFDEEAGRGGTGSEVIPVDMSDETLAWPRFVPVIRLLRKRALSDCCSWADKNKQAFYTVKYQQEVAECEVQREHVVTSPLEVHEKLRVHYRRQLMRGWPHAKIMTQFSDVRCGLVVLWKRGRKFTGGYSEAKLKVCIGHLQGGMRAMGACTTCTCTCAYSLSRALWHVHVLRAHMCTC